MRKEKFEEGGSKNSEGTKISERMVTGKTDLEREKKRRKGKKYGKKEGKQRPPSPMLLDPPGVIDDKDVLFRVQKGQEGGAAAP